VIGVSILESHGLHSNWGQGIGVPIGEIEMISPFELISIRLGDFF